MSQTDPPGATPHGWNATVGDLAHLVQLKWDLLVLELAQSRRAATRLSVVVAIAAVCAAAVLPLVATAAAEVLAGKYGLPTWGWQLIAAGVLAVAAALIGLAGWRRFKAEYVGLEESIESLREDLAWLRHLGQAE